jgi:S1-C subfamily serine protease
MKKILTGAGIVVFIFLVGGLGGVYIDRYILPSILALPWVAEKGWFDKAAEQITVINKTEEVTVREDDSVERSIAQASTTTVTVLYPKRVTGRVTESEFSLPGVMVTNDGVLAVYSETGATLPTPRVIFNNGEKHEVEVLGYDNFSNLLFYKVKGGTNTATIVFANSDDIRTGKKLILIKNSIAASESHLGFALLAGRAYSFNLAGETATSEKWEGVFDITLDQAAASFVGAPAVTYSGEMVGIVGSLAKEKGTQYFLVPANLVRASLEKISGGGLILQGTLGVSYTTLTPENAFVNSLAQEQGALITDILPRSGTFGAQFSAKKIGLKSGDIVTKIDQTTIDLMHPLSAVVYTKKSGDEVSLTVLRKGEEKVLTGKFE